MEQPDIEIRRIARFILRHQASDDLLARVRAQSSREFMKVGEKMRQIKTKAFKTY